MISGIISSYLPLLCQSIVYADSVRLGGGGVFKRPYSGVSHSEYVCDQIQNLHAYPPQEKI